MSITLNNAAKNAVLDALIGLFPGGTLTIRTGAAPGAANAATGTVLATITLPTPAWSAASGGAGALSGTWEDTSADNTGTAAHFRIVSSDTNKVLEGTVTASGGGGDMIVSNTSFASGQPFEVTSFALGTSN